MDCRVSVVGIKMESQTSKGMQNFLDELGDSSSRAHSNSNHNVPCWVPCFVLVLQILYNMYTRAYETLYVSTWSRYIQKKCTVEDRLVEKVVDIVVSHISVHHKRWSGLRQVLVEQRQWREVHMLQVHEKKFLIDITHASHFQQIHHMAKSMRKPPCNEWIRLFQPHPLLRGV